MALNLGQPIIPARSSMPPLAEPLSDNQGQLSCPCHGYLSACSHLFNVGDGLGYLIEIKYFIDVDLKPACAHHTGQGFQVLIFASSRETGEFVFID